MPIAVLRPFEFRHEASQDALHALDWLRQRACDLRQRQRFLGDINHGFEHRLQLRVAIATGVGVSSSSGKAIGSGASAASRAPSSAALTSVGPCGSLSSGVSAVSDLISSSSIRINGNLFLRSQSRLWAARKRTRRRNGCAAAARFRRTGPSASPPPPACAPSPAPPETARSWRGACAAARTPAG